MTRPRFDNVFNTGHILQAVVLLTSLMGFTWYQSSWQTRLEEAQKQLSTSVLKLETATVPLVASDVVQNEKIGSITNTLQNIRDSQQHLANQIGGVREDMAAIKAVMEADRRVRK